MSAGDVERYVRGNEGRYSVDRARWASFLRAPEEIPTYRDWPRLLLALRELDRWLHDPRLAELSDYMRASEARALMERLEPTLTAAGVLVSRDGAGADYWSTFEENVTRLLEKLGPTASRFG